VDFTLALGNSAPDIISILSPAWVHLGKQTFGFLVHQLRNMLDLKTAQEMACQHITSESITFGPEGVDFGEVQA
jgi:hypothetical protein